MTRYRWSGHGQVARPAAVTGLHHDQDLKARHAPASPTPGGRPACISADDMHDTAGNKKSKVHHRSLNLCRCVILVSKLTNRPFKSSNLSICVIPVPKLENQTFTSSNLFNHVIPVSKLDFESHMGQNKAI